MTEIFDAPLELGENLLVGLNPARGRRSRRMLNVFEAFGVFYGPHGRGAGVFSVAVGLHLDDFRHVGGRQSKTALYFKNKNKQKRSFLRFSALSLSLSLGSPC